MAWTLRRILIVTVVLSSLAVAGTLYWVTATYQRFAIGNQREIAASTLSHLVLRQVEDQHQRKVNPFIDEWSRLSTLVQGMAENNAEKARLAANRMMLTLEVAEGRVRLRNVVIHSRDMQVVASADKGSGESLSTIPPLLKLLRARDQGSARRITSFRWRGLNERPLNSTIAPIGGFRVSGFVEFVSDPIVDIADVQKAVQGHFRLLAVNGTTVFESHVAGSPASESGTANLDTLRVPIAGALGDTWAVATLTRDVSAFEASVSRLRNRALAIVAIVIMGSVLVGWLMLRLVVFNRLKQFAAVTSMLAEGRTDVTIPSVGPDEFRIMRTSLESLRTAVYDRERATLALRESEQRLRAIIDNTPNEVYLTDADGRYTLVNASFAALVGVAPVDMIGKTVADYYSEDLAETMTREEAKVFSSGGISQREFEFESKEQGSRVGLMVKFPVLDAAGTVISVGTITSDITELKQFEEELLAAREKAEEQSKLQRIILDNVGQGILVFHANTKPVLWNELATRFTGLSDDFLSKGLTLEQCDRFQFKKFAFDDNTIAIADDFKRRLSSSEQDFVVTYQRRGVEGTGWVQVSLRVLSDGMVVQTYQDITDLRRAIEAAQDAQRLAENANRAKSDFLSNMSHELRTPLNAIIGFTEFVIDNDVDPVTPEQETSLSQVLKAGRHLLGLINDVLDLAKIEAGIVSLSLEAVDAGRVIDECVSLTSSLAARSNVEVHNLLHAELPPIEADLIRFKQVFLNLLSNAIKYNRDPGTVYIEQGQASSGMVRIGVRDNGPGIPRDRLDQLFDPFNRLGAENSSIEGTGIGLTITKSLVERMGGRITVDSIVGKGSTFWLDMPVSERRAEQRATSRDLDSGIAADLEGLILYIEDNPANLELVRKILSRQPQVDFIDAPTGELGIERARSEIPDVIVVDINLPGLDGFQVLDLLAALPETRHIPVIALTAAATESDIRRGRAAGFFAYLTKPIAARELLATIRRALRPTGRPAADAPLLLSDGTVLVVDDMPINLAVTQKQLAKLGIACECVDDPRQALDMLKAGGYALALVDIGMPGLNGMELTRRLRAAEQESRNPRTPVIALTASYGSGDDIGIYRKAGMDGQLTKPVVLDELALTLHRWLSPGKGSYEGTEPSSARLPFNGDRPPIDIGRFHEIIGTDDGETVREIFDLFVKSIPDELENLSRAIAARDKALSRHAAHRFKSAARNTAARRLSELLERIEKESQSGVWDVTDRDLQSIREECARVIAYMRPDA